VGTAIELMIVDAFLAASKIYNIIYKYQYINTTCTYVDDYLKIADMVDNPEDYLYLTDNIVHTIESSKCPELEKARGIIKRIRKRELYKFVDEFLVPPELEGHLNQVSTIYILL
jgi:hypothetical protein